MRDRPNINIQYIVNIVSFSLLNSMELSECKRAQIAALCQSGMTQVSVAKQLGLSRQCVSYTMKRYNETGSFTTRPRRGRPLATTPATDRSIRRACVAAPTASAASIAAQLPVPVSTRTIQRRLHDKFNLKAYRPAKKPYLSKKNVRDRVAFCKKVNAWTPEMWSRVLFSDESTIRQFAHVGSSMIRRPWNTRFNPRYVIPTVKHSPSVMVWGSFGCSGRGNLWFLPPNTTMRAANYLEVLKERLRPMMARRQTTIFMHDGAPCHQARIVKSWLAEQRVDVLSPWPGNSPDLNPIENLWVILKRKVAARNPTSASDLKEAIKHVWCEEITQELCQKLVHSMPDRISAVLRNRGQCTKY